MMKTLLTIGLLAAVLLPSALPGRLALPPCICIGRVLNFERINAAVKDPNATIALHKADPADATKPGKLLARTTLRNYDNTVCNYRLEVPVSDLECDSKAMIGETLIPVITFGGETYSADRGLTLVKAPGSTAVIEQDFCLLLDADGDGIDDEYATLLQAYANALELSDAAVYDPEADYDGDGKSNREEYLAGTSPLSAGDRFRITGFEIEDDFVTLTFIISPARSYTLAADAELETGSDWGRKAFRDRADPAASEMTVYHMTDFEGAIEKTIYIPKADAAVPSFFYKVLSH